MFPCTGCGLCCHQAAGLRKIDPTFPYSARADGSCEKLIGRKCSVYATRPTICNVEKMAEVLKVDKADWYKQNAAACNSMIREAGEDERYLVKV